MALNRVPRTRTTSFSWLVHACRTLVLRGSLYLGFDELLLPDDVVDGLRREYITGTCSSIGRIRIRRFPRNMFSRSSCSFKAFWKKNYIKSLDSILSFWKIDFSEMKKKNREYGQRYGIRWIRYPGYPRRAGHGFLDKIIVWRVRFRFVFGGLQITKDPLLNISIHNAVCSL